MCGGNGCWWPLHSGCGWCACCCHCRFCAAICGVCSEQGARALHVVTLWVTVVLLPLLVLIMYALLVPLLMQWGLGAVLSPSYGDAWVYMGMALLILAYPAAILVYALVLLAFGRIATPRATQPPVV